MPINNPGLPNRIVAMAEKEAQSRHDSERLFLKNQTRKIDGSILVAISFIVAAVIIIYLGNPIPGTLVILVSLATTLINRFFPRK